MEERNLYDSSSIAARCKREQFLKEAEEYRVRRHIAALQKPEKEAKAVRPEKRPRPGILPETNPHPAPTR